MSGPAHRSNRMVDFCLGMLLWTTSEGKRKSYHSEPMSTLMPLSYTSPKPGTREGTKGLLGQPGRFCYPCATNPYPSWGILPG